MVAYADPGQGAALSAGVLLIIGLVVLAALVLFVRWVWGWGRKEP